MTFSWLEKKLNNKWNKLKTPGQHYNNQTGKHIEPQENLKYMVDYIPMKQET